MRVNLISHTSKEVWFYLLSCRPMPSIFLVILTFFSKSWSIAFKQRFFYFETVDF